MKKFLLAATALVALLPAAMAADMTVAGRAPVYQKAPPAPSTYSWTGLYLTGNVNYSANFAGSNLAGAGTVIDFNTIPHGPGAGGGLRALWQLNGSPWVIGIDSDISWVNLRSTATIAPVSLSSATNWIGDVDGVLGLALGPDGRLLGAALGGASCGGTNGSVTSTNTFAQSASATSCGWNAGAMLDYALTDNIGIFIKGKYTDLGAKQLNLGGGVTSNVRYQDITQELGFTFKFF